MEINVNIKEFDRRFKENYGFLYENRDRVAGFHEAMEAFDEFVKTHGKFVGEYVNYRQDFISSDREAAAFMFTLDDMGALV